MKMLLLIAFLAFTPLASAQEIEWHRNLDQGIAAAKESGRPMLIDFWASWCVPCAVMEKELWSSAEGKKLASKFVCVRLDFDKATSAIRKFHVNSVPSVVFTDSWGNFLTKLIGFEGPQRYLYALNVMPANFRSIDASNQALSVNSKDMEALRTIARFYYEAGAYEFSNNYYDRAMNQATTTDQKSEMMLALGWNHLKLKDYESAETVFHDCLKTKEFAGRDVALFGMVVSSLGQHKRKGAEKAFEELSKSFPNSPATEKAGKLLQTH